jgi:hypothetical protein
LQAVVLAVRTMVEQAQAVAAQADTAHPQVHLGVGLLQNYQYLFSNLLIMD